MNQDLEELKPTLSEDSAIESSKTGLEAVRPWPYLQLVLPTSIIIAALLISGTIFYTRVNRQPNTDLLGKNPNPTRTAPADLRLSANDHVLGNKNAKVVLFEYSDFQCPFCRSFWKSTYGALKKEYIDTGKIQLVYRHFPLESIHPLALAMAKATECAAEKGKFWSFHDKLFQEQERLGASGAQPTLADIKKWGTQLGLGNDFSACVDSDKYDARVRADLEYGGEIGVTGTPTFFIAGQTIVGAQPYNVFKSALDAALAQ